VSVHGCPRGERLSTSLSFFFRSPSVSPSRAPRPLRLPLLLPPSFSFSLFFSVPLPPAPLSVFLFLPRALPVSSSLSLSLSASAPLSLRAPLPLLLSLSLSLYGFAERLPIPAGVLSSLGSPCEIGHRTTNELDEFPTSPRSVPVLLPRLIELTLRFARSRESFSERASAALDSAKERGTSRDSLFPPSLRPYFPPLRSLSLIPAAAARFSLHQHDDISPLPNYVFPGESAGEFIAPFAPQCSLLREIFPSELVGGYLPTNTGLDAKQARRRGLDDPPGRDRSFSSIAADQHRSISRKIPARESRASANSNGRWPRGRSPCCPLSPRVLWRTAGGRQLSDSET